MTLLQLKTPESEDDLQWLMGQMDTYANVVYWLATYIERRAYCGDMDTRQVLDEIEKHICQKMRDGFDKHGAQ